jgi:hypothetical protein
MIETVPTSDIAKIAADKSFNVADKVSNRVIYVHLNQWNDKSAPFVTAKDGSPLGKNPFRDARVRKALSIAINRDAIADRIMEKRAIPAGQLLADSFFGTSRKLRPANTTRGREEASRRGGLPQRLRDHDPRSRTTATSTTTRSRRRSPSSTRAPGSPRRWRRCPRRCISTRRPRAISATCCSAGAPNRASKARPCARSSPRATRTREWA